MDDEFEGKGAKVWKGLGRESPQLTMAPLTPMMPVDQLAGRYSRFSGLHGKETPGIFDVSQGRSMEYAGTGARG